MPAPRLPLGRRRRPPSRVRLLPLGRDGMEALLVGDLAGASARARVELPATFLEPKGLWRHHVAAIVADRDHEAWAPRVVATDPERVAVGNAGFHGPPGAGGRVEIGFAIDPPHQGRGHARAAVAALLRLAAADEAVQVVRARVRPSNAPSLAVVRGAGFAPVGEEFDEEEGLLVVLERPAR